MIKRVKTPEGNRYRYDIYVGGRRVRSPRGEYFPTKEECLDAISTIRADYRRGVYQFPADRCRISIKEVRDEWLELLRRKRRHPRHIRRAERAFEYLASIIPLASSVTDLTTKHLEKLVDRREAAGIKRVTIFNDLAPILASLSHAADQLPELRNWRPPKKPEGIHKTKFRRERVITRDEERRILHELRKPLERGEARYRSIREQTADIFELALHTGLRLGEILTLTWAQCHLERSPAHPYGWIRARATKTGDRMNEKTDDRTVPVNQLVSEMLLRRSKKRGSTFVFPATGTRAKGEQHQTMLHWSFESACTRAGVKYGRDVAGGLVFHDTRHTAITRMLQGGADLKTVMEIAGHRDASTTIGYTHSTPRSRYAAIASLVDDSSSAPDEELLDQFESTLEPEIAESDLSDRKGRAG